jgi:glycine oxidase
MQENKKTNIGIVGAGVMGRVLAWQIRQLGCSVTLFDKDDIDFGDAAAFTAAGMLTPYSEVESAELMIYNLGMSSLKLWQGIADQLNGDLGFHQHGSLIVAHGNDRPDYEHFFRQVKSKINPSQSQCANLNQQQLEEVEPELGKNFSEALFLSEEAWLCPQKTLRLLADRLFEEGVVWHANQTVKNLGQGFIETNTGKYQFDWVIDCRGLGAKESMSNLRGVRGELIWLQAPEVKIKHLVRLMHPRYRMYLVPKGYDDLYVIGATQIESNDKGPITVRSSLELLSAVYSLHGGFAEARIIDMRTNCRPAFNDNLPKINYSSGLISVNGLFRHGFLMSPALGEEISRLIINPDYHSNYQSLVEKVA